MISVLLIVLLSIFIAIIGIILLSLGWGIGAYNTFRIAQQDIKTQWSNILTEYQRRSDLFFNLVEATKSHKKFEQQTLVQVAQARGGNFGSTKTNQISKLNGLDKMFAGMKIVFERYPKLLSYKQHDKLMEEVRITEDRINVARTDYNEIVGDYNKIIMIFPKSFIAHMFSFTVEEFFKNEEGTSSAPKINLN